MAVLSTGCGPTRTGVAPWDVPDAPNPNPGAPWGSPAYGDPAGLRRAEGTVARLADGTTVELVSVGRRIEDPSGNAPLDSLPIWKPDGAPLHAARSDGWNNVLRPASALEGRGARDLEFRVVSPSSGEATVTGYVPEGAHRKTPRPELHGWDPADRLFLTDRGPSVYRTCVVVDDRRASHYRFALARGEWKTVASVALDHKETDRVLASGEWGTLRRVAPVPDPPGMSFTKHIMPHVDYVVDPPAGPPAFATQVRLLDAVGKPNASLYRWTPPKGLDLRFPGPAVRVEVSARPYEWVEFSGVHYDPDPKRWPKGYWGAEGEKAISRADGVALEAIVRPGPGSYPGGWEPYEVYAPDGRLWRNHSDPRAVSPAFSGGTMPSDPFVAGFRFDEGRVSAATPARIEGFAADGAEPGRGLREPLTRSWPAQGPIGQYLFARPKTPYVQFAVRYASDRWTKAGEIAVPQIVFPLVKPEDRAGYDDGSHYFTMFSVSLRSMGEAGLYWHTRTANPDSPGYGERNAAVTWPKDEEARVVAHLFSGRRVPLAPNSFGVGGDGSTSQSVDFNQASDSDPVYDTTRNDPKNGVRLKLSEITAFEIETRGFSAPVYVVAKLPPR